MIPLNLMMLGCLPTNRCRTQEVIICRDPLVASAVMFGRGREQNGIIIQPTKGHEIDPRDPVALAQFRNDIW
jgi:hypothetical protein